MWLVPGSLYEHATDGNPYNTALAISPEGEIVARYRKVFPCPPPATVRWNSSVRQRLDQPGPMYVGGGVPHTGLDEGRSRVPRREQWRTPFSRRGSASWPEEPAHFPAARCCTPLTWRNSLPLGGRRPVATAGAWFHVAEPCRAAVYPVDGRLRRLAP
ncbi:hypothetical protein [Streptomyces sp. NPDC054883]